MIISGPGRKESNSNSPHPGRMETLAGRRSRLTGRSAFRPRFAKKEDSVEERARACPSPKGWRACVSRQEVRHGAREKAVMPERSGRKSVPSGRFVRRRIPAGGHACPAGWNWGICSGWPIGLKRPKLRGMWKVEFYRHGKKRQNRQ